MTEDNLTEPDEVTSGCESASLSVFFPCYNEQANVARTVEKAVGVLEKLDIDYEIIIVNDGSCDGTARIADKIAEERLT